MQRIVKFLDAHKILLKMTLSVLIIWCMYNCFPYLLMDRPHIDAIEPDTAIEKVYFYENSQFKISGTNLNNVIGIYINGIYEGDCAVVSSSAEELTLSLPPQYYQEAQELAIQLEVRINSDLTCMSNKITVTMLPATTLPVPFIVNTEPALLCYDGSLLQTVYVYGNNFTADSMVTVNGDFYPTTYDQEAERLAIQVPYEKWCTEEELALQVLQSYTGYPTHVKSKKLFLETDRSEPKSRSNIRQWTQYPFLALSFGEINGLMNTNSKEAFLYNYGHGQRLFGVDLTFSSDCILYGNHVAEYGHGMALPESFAEAQDASESTLLRFEEICGLMHEYEDIYVYASLQDVQDLQSFRTVCQHILAQIAKTDSGILNRLIIPVKDEASYRLLLELEPLANAVYAPGKHGASENEILDFIRSTDVRTAILPWEIITSSLTEALGALECVIYASGLDTDDGIAYALSNGVYGIASCMLPIEHWQILEKKLRAGNIRIPSSSPCQSENEAFLIDYLSALDSERYLILFSVKDEASHQLTPAIRKAMKALGLFSIPDDAFQYSYVAVIENGTVSYEECGNYFLQYAGNHEGLEFYVESGGFNVGNISSIQINGVEYSLNQRGLNIVVYDFLLERVMDSICFDLYDGASPSFSED